MCHPAGSGAGTKRSWRRIAAGGSGTLLWCQPVGIPTATKALGSPDPVSSSSKQRWVTQVQCICHFSGYGAMQRWLCLSTCKLLCNGCVTAAWNAPVGPCAKLLDMAVACCCHTLSSCASRIYTSPSTMLVSRTQAAEQAAAGGAVQLGAAYTQAQVRGSVLCLTSLHTLNGLHSYIRATALPQQCV
jgi:hypothetical protein